MGQINTLLSSFSLNTIIIVIVAVISLWYSAAKIKDYLSAKTQAIRDAERRKVEEERALSERLTAQENDLNDLKASQLLLSKSLTKIADQIDLLVSSDMADIKSYITQRYNEFTKLGYIDMHSLQACEKRYEYYRLEGGNSFVQQLMTELRNLPIKK